MSVDLQNTSRNTLLPAAASGSSDPIPRAFCAEQTLGSGGAILALPFDDLVDETVFYGI
ncbi:MAG: hypothetical protein ACI9MR_002332 [Myxococcota bacterium]|jgi:hypothetical protein